MMLFKTSPDTSWINVINKMYMNIDKNSMDAIRLGIITVSYTHLTLPTILRV